jgi:GT2 family glycosyltransferase
MTGESNKIVSVIIVSAGAKERLKLCLDSVAQQSYPDLAVTVIDNSGNPHFSQAIMEILPRAKVIPNPQERSYTKALNLGITASAGDFVLCLNDDVVLDKNFIKEALKGFSSGVKIGAVGGKILRMDGHTIDSTGLYLSFWRTAKERGYSCVDKGQFGKEGLIFGVSGAVAFYRRRMLEEIKESGGYFDPGFHFFYEDLDIAWRANRAGWKSYYIPTAVAYHVRGASARGASGRDKPFARRFLNDALYLDLIRNRYLAIIKNESLTGFLLHFPAMVLYDIFSWGHCLISRPRLLRKFFMNLQDIKKALRKRIREK